MKTKFLVAAIAALFAGNVLATQTQTPTGVNAVSGAAVSSSASTVVIGNGFTSQTSGAAAWNTTTGAAAGNSLINGTAASSNGGTVAYSAGVQTGSSFGVTGASAVQYGSVTANANNGKTTSHADVGSFAVTGNINNGLAAQGTTVQASNVSAKVVIFKTSVNGPTSATSGGIALGAFGTTGGTANASGAAH